MSNPNVRRALAALGAAVALLALPACGGDETGSAGPPETTSPASPTRDPDAADSSTAAPPGPSRSDSRTIVVTVAEGAPVGGLRTETVRLDERVRLEISGDATEEIHVHTYDLVEPLAPGSPAVFEFEADIPGVHEIELHGSGVVLLELQVEP